jgi:hypothetical protein
VSHHQHAVFQLQRGSSLLRRRFPLDASCRPPVLPLCAIHVWWKKVTREILDREWRQKLWEDWNDGSGILGQYPKRSDYPVEAAENGPSIAVGGGFD